MLVLTRRPNEKILLPGLDATIQVVGIKGSAVRLGIDAPPGVEIVREELLARGATGRPAAARPDPLRDLNHLLRNRLNAAAIGLGLLRRQIRAGASEAAADIIDRLERDFRALRDQADAAVSAARTPQAPGSKRSARSALVVEDDTNERELLAGFLRVAGLAVATAADGCDALEYLRSNPRPDLLLLDMVLPRCDGPSTIRAIRRDPAHDGLKIFALTGHAPDTFPPDAAGGVTRWFHKPLDPEALLRDIELTLAG
jgi:two-component system, OmpR family, response regulator